MMPHLTIGLLNGEITDVTTEWMASAEVERHFSIGEVYAYTQEPQGMQWRMLQRSATYADRSGTWASMLPCKPEQVPEIVRMVALMRE